MLPLPALLLLLHVGTLTTRPYILFANRKDIRLLELTDNKKRAATNIIVKNLEDAAALEIRWSPGMAPPDRWNLKMLFFQGVAGGTKLSM